MKRILLVLALLIVLALTTGLMRSHGVFSTSSIQPHGTPEIALFTASPNRIAPGQEVTVSWMVRGVETVSIEWGPERNPRANLQKRTGLPAAGSLTVHPEESTVFILECQTPGLVVCMAASAGVRVRP